ncbi:MAG TPA: sugar ABC transporter ATP-binding protein, partial [Acetobacteraceae bacterium]|nr:sugar ABC transporter ATP-binding protein [Acetobacteraceae bacterium]
STLVKILSGIVRPDAGTVRLGGEAFEPPSLLAARAAGVSTAFQELSLLPNLTVATNLTLPRQRKGWAGLASPRLGERGASALLAEFNARDIPPGALVSDLSLAEKQRVEIVRALSHRPRLLVLDEPTAALAEPEWLFAIVERLAAQGVAVLYISHRLAEVRRLCQRGTVLRNGESIGTVDLADAQDADIFRMMVGTGPEQALQAGKPAAVPGDAPAIAVRDLRGPGVDGLSLELRGGEILGVAALEGQGQRELFRMLGGVTPFDGGVMEIDGRPRRLASPAEALRLGVGFVPEERKTEGIFLGLSTGSNISLPILDQVAHLGLIDRGRERGRVAHAAHDVDLADRYLGMRISGLSGGNQQKALIARVVASGARHLVLFDPTRGVDVGTKQVIYGVIRGFAAAGGSVLMYSTELSELVQLADRCLVLYRGRIAGELAGKALTEARLVSLATGHGAQAG